MKKPQTRGKDRAEARLLQQFGHLLGMPVRVKGEKRDRMVTKLLHEEPGGKICVETSDLYAFSFNGEWKSEPRVKGAIMALGPCTRITAPAKARVETSRRKPTKKEKAE